MVDEMTPGMYEAMSAEVTVLSMPAQVDVDQSTQYLAVIERLMHASVPAAPQRTNVQEAETVRRWSYPGNAQQGTRAGRLDGSESHDPQAMEIPIHKCLFECWSGRMAS
eukprot:5130834-Amphidinium_carterae.2